MGIKKYLNKLMAFFSDNHKEDATNGKEKATVLLRCGDREIVGDEYNILAFYNHHIQSTEFGTSFFRRILCKYGKFCRVHGREDGIKYVFNFENEKSLSDFIKECRRYLKLS